MSNGNIPSRWAHTVQTVMMAEALATLVPGFRLLIATSLAERVRPRVDLWRWYGVERPFPLVRPCLWLWRRDPLFATVFEPRFSRVADRCAALLRPHLVWTRSYPAAAGCLRRGIPVLFEAHSLPAPRWRHELASVRTSPLLRGFVTNSEPLADAFRAAGVRPEAVAAFPNASEPRLLRLDRADRGAARAALGIAPDAAVALYVGSLSQAKGVETLLGAAARLHAVTFAVLGGSATDVEVWRSRAGTATNVDFRGFVAHGDLPAWFTAADLGLFPNSNDDEHAACTSPLKVLEYAAAGLPVVAAAIPAIAAWLGDGGHALLHRPDDDADLARVLGQAVADPAPAHAGAARARERARGYTWLARARAILERFAPELLA